MRIVGCLLLACAAFTAEEGLHLMRSHPWRDRIPGVTSLQSCTKVDTSGLLRRCVDAGYGSILMVCGNSFCSSKEPTTGIHFSPSEMRMIGIKASPVPNVGSGGTAQR